MSQQKELQQSEQVVAVLPAKKVIGEQELSKSVSLIELEAESIVVTNDEQFIAAAEFGRMLKGKSAEVSAFFEPMKKAAYKAHSEICNREKVMLAPLLSAESILKNTMGNYLEQCESRIDALKVEMQKRALEQVEEKDAMAKALEEKGDFEGAEMARMEAKMAMAMSNDSVICFELPKADGVSASSDWEIISVSDDLVPVSLEGYELRPVNKTAILKLIKENNGRIDIPGVKFKAVKKMSFRR